MVVFLLLAAVFFLALFVVYFIIHMIFWFVCCFGCCGHCCRGTARARLHAKRQERFMRMFARYEAEAMMAKAKGEPIRTRASSLSTGTRSIRRGRRHTHGAAGVRV